MRRKIKYIILKQFSRGDRIKTLAKTAAWVTALSVIERFIGFIYRIYLSRTIGSEGIGVYQIALTVFGLLLTITSSGIPITVSRMMTRYRTENNPHAVQSTVTSAILVCLIISVPIVAAFYIFGDHLSFLFSDERCGRVLSIVIPGLILTSVYAVLRGAFWGNKDFAPYSIIEVLEEAVMVVVGILLIHNTTSQTEGITRAAWAVLISYLFSFVTASVVYLSRGGKFHSPLKTLKPLFLSATPITCMRTATSLINSLIAVVLPARLISAGLSQTTATAQFGAAFGMAFPILFMPGTLIGSVALVLVPELSENYYKKQMTNLKNNIDKAIKFSVFIACIIIPVLLAYGTQLGIFFYKSEEAGKYLTFASPAMLPMSLCMISTSMLNSMNMEKKTLLYYSFGAVFMLAAICFLPRVCGIYSLFIGLLGQFSITAIFNLVALSKKIKAKPDYLGFTLKSILFIIPSYLLGIFSRGILLRFTSNALTCFIGGGATALFMLALLAIFDLLSPIGIKLSKIRQR